MSDLPRAQVIHGYIVAVLAHIIFWCAKGFVHLLLFLNASLLFRWVYKNWAAEFFVIVAAAWGLNLFARYINPAFFYWLAGYLATDRVMDFVFDILDFHVKPWF